MKLRSVCLAVVVAACGVTCVAGAASAAPSTQDTAWMVAAHQSNLAEIAAGNAAVAQGRSAEVKRLGAMFVDMHTKLDADLTAAATQLAVDLPATPTPSQDQQLAAVTAKAGADFDTAWIAQQTAAHQETLQATNVETATGADPSVIGLATAATPVVQQHLTELQSAAGSGAPTAINTGSGGQAAGSGADHTMAALLVAGLGIALVGSSVWWLLRRRHS